MLFKKHCRGKTWSEANDASDHINELLINGALAERCCWNKSAIRVVHEKSRERGMAVHGRMLDKWRQRLEVKIPLITLETTHDCV